MKRTVPVILFAVLVAVFGFQVRSAGAYSQYSANQDATNCRACHGDFRSNPYTSLSDGQNWGDDLHDIHRNTMLGGDCDVCHGSGSRFPVILDSSVGGTGLQAVSCVGCHGRNEDVTPNDGAFGGPGPGRGDGLRAHHAAAGVGICAGCHTADAVQVGEDVLPPYYATPGTGHPSMPTDSCNPSGSEDFAGLAEGLDNDGDNVYDGADPDCAVAGTPDITVTDSVAPAGDLQVPFGSVTVGASSDQTVTVTNDGTADLVIGTVASADALAAPFSIPAGTDGCSGMTLAPLASCTITVRFSPTSLGAANDTFDIPSDDPDENPVTVSVSGTGVTQPPPGGDGGGGCSVIGSGGNGGGGAILFLTLLAILVTLRRQGAKARR